MATIVVFDPADSAVSGRVVEYHASANTPAFDAVVHKLVNPDLSSLSSVPYKYWKESSGSVVEMTQAEKDTLDGLSVPPASDQVCVDEGIVSAASSDVVDASSFVFTAPYTSTYRFQWYVEYTNINNQKVTEVSVSMDGSEVGSDSLFIGSPAMQGKYRAFHGFVDVDLSKDQQVPVDIKVTAPDGGTFKARRRRVVVQEVK